MIRDENRSLLVPKINYCLNLIINELLSGINVIDLNSFKKNIGHMIRISINLTGKVSNS